MRLAIPAQERPARNVLIAGFKCAKIMPNRVERVSRFSARPAVSYIERSTRSPRMGNVESEKGLRTPDKTSMREFGEARLKHSRLWSILDAIHSKLMQEVSLFCGGNFADDATLVLLSYKQQGQSGRAELS